MDSIRKVTVVFAVMSLGFAGCDNKLLDPTQVGRFRPTPAVNVILDSLGVAEEAPVAWENAEEPRPKDTVAQKSDYALRPGDLVQISIFELFQEGVPLVGQFLLSETGQISIPEVGRVQAAGLTETQLEDEIKRMLSPNILKEPTVTVTLLESQQRTFSIMGNGVPRPGRFLIPRYDFRLTDALATAGGPMQFNVSYVYLSRKDGTQAAPASAPATVKVSKATTEPELELLGSKSSGPDAHEQPSPALQPQPSLVPGARSEIPEPKEPAEKFELEREMLDMITPSADKSKWPTSTRVVPAAPAGKPKDENVAATVMPYGFQVLVPPKAPQDRRTTALDVIQTPMVLASGANTPAQATLPEPKASEKYDWVFRNGQWVPVPVKSVAQTPAKPAETGAGAQTEWVFRDGQWVQIRKGEAPPKEAPATPPPVAAQPEMRQPTLPIGAEELPPEMEWDQAETRVLKIPADKLLAGDPRYNVVIKPGDTVYVPVDIIGEFFIMGNVNRSGVINITGRPMTLKMAIAAAGGLGPLAWPKNVEVVRRIGKEKEEIVMVDLDKIASGEQPDFFIKPHDLINVGTHPTARWRAVLRNAFRAAYGFGFVYDRNFADADFGKGFVLPHWL